MRRRLLRTEFVAAGLLFLGGLVLPFVPLFWRPDHGFGSDLRDFGSLIADAWALGAGLLTVYAARFQSEAGRTQLRNNVANACLAEIESVWRYVDECGTIDLLRERSTALIEEVNSLERAFPTSDEDQLDTYRGHLGESWLSLQVATPEVFGALPSELAADVTEYYCRLRNVIGRLNWLTNRQFKRKEVDWISKVHTLSYIQLRDLSVHRGSLSARLKHLIQPETAGISTEAHVAGPGRDAITL